jgi:hypothetical protein
MGFKNAVAQEWNFTIEHQIGNWAGRASYLGSQTHHIPYNSIDLNRPRVQQPNVPIQNQRPYQPWGAIGSYLSAGKQNFNQLQLGLQKSFPAAYHSRLSTSSRAVWIMSTMQEARIIPIIGT